MRSKIGYRDKVICKNCGKVFMSHLCRSKRSKNRYCSPKCYFISKKGKVYTHGVCKKGTHNSIKTEFKCGKQHPNYKGRTIDKTGYVWILMPTHPFCNGDGHVREHRLVMETHLGRYLDPIEVVHHINGDKHDNRLENLMLFSSDREHHAFHTKQRKQLKEVQCKVRA